VAARAPEPTPAPVPAPRQETAWAGASELEDLTRAALVQLAEQHGVATYGTKADLAERLRLAVGA